MRIGRIRAGAMLALAGLVLGWLPLAAAAEPDGEAVDESVATAAVGPSATPEIEPQIEAEEPPSTEQPAGSDDSVEQQAEPADPSPDADQSLAVVDGAALTDTAEPTPTAMSEPTSTPTASAQPDQVTGGALSWGLKASFRSYLTGPIAHGSITTGDPATDDGSVTRFPAGGGLSDGEVSTLGSVRYYGHDGDLDLTLLNPRLRVSSPAMLLVDARDSDGVWHYDLELASVDLAGAVSTAGSTVTVTRAATHLTSSGAEVFVYNGAPMYPAGTELDPLSATFTVADSGSSTSPSPSATTIPTPTTATPSPSATASTTAKLPGGLLSWGVKASFRSYVTGPIANGAITVSSGAGASGGVYRFGQSSTTADLPDAAGTTRYRGTVRFTGHGGELDLAFSDPAIRISGSSAVLSVSASGYGRVALANLDLSSGTRSTSGGAVSYSGVPATLTSAGAKVFSYQGNAFYSAGTRLDPVSFTIGARSSAGSGTTLVAAAVTPSATPTASASPTATASPSASAAPVVGCPATQATLSWGFKESFRAYVSGSIANGDWTTAGNASYQTPLFTWTSGTGTRATDGAGQLDFTGEIRFTGHSGALDTTIANPVVQFAGPDAATLIVDYAGTAMEDALAGVDNLQAVDDLPFVDLDLQAAEVATDGDLVTLSDIPATLTDAGSTAFPNYPAGTAFDPVTLSYRIGSDCTTAATAPDASSAAASAAPSAGSSEEGQAADSGQPDWVPWLGGGAIGAVLASGTTALLLRRRGGIA